MIFDSEPSPETTEAIVAARSQFRIRRKLAVIATIALSASWGATVPFVAGFPLYSFWESVGKYLLILSMGLILVWGYLVRSAVNSWALLSSLENEY
jgi:hypothetical protein